MLLQELMNRAEVRKIAKRITIGHRPCGIYVEEDDAGPYIQLWYREADIYNGVMAEQLGRKWYIEGWWGETEVVKTIYAAVQVSDEHRRREHFRLDGYAIFSPHIPVNLLKRGAMEHHSIVSGEPLETVRYESPVA